MKYLVITIMILPLIVSAQTLTTDNFVIKIKNECEEGNIDCDKVRFIYSPAEIKQKQIIIGKTVHTKCADGITKCGFQGYQFQDNGARYFIYNSGVLEITDCQGNKLLVEQGKWQY